MSFLRSGDMEDDMTVQRISATIPCSVDDECGKQVETTMDISYWICSGQIEIRPLEEGRLLFKGTDLQEALSLIFKPRTVDHG